MFMASAGWKQFFTDMRLEWQHLRRDRMTISLLFVVPAIQLLLFGFAIRPEQLRVPIALAISDSNRAAQLESAIQSTGRFDLIASRLPTGGAEQLLKRGHVLVALEVPPLATFDDDSPQQPVRVIVDFSNPAATGPALQSLEAAYWRRIAEFSPLAKSSSTKIQIERLYNPDARSAWSFAPSLIGVSIMISMLLFGALSGDRRPDSRAVSVVSVAAKILVYSILAILQAVMVLALSRFLFDLPVRGNVLALIACVPVFAAAHVVFGFVIAARTQQAMQAVQATVAFYFPAMLLSGFLYPFEALPRWARAIGEMLPLTHFIRAARDCLLHGSSAGTILAHLWPVAVFLAGVSVVLAVTARRSAVEAAT